MKIVILGGGPCGLGAAWRLTELGHEDWQLFERDQEWGGLASSYQDAEGFWWDVGGHVLFSHYSYFDRVMDTLLGAEDGWVFHEREAWIRMQSRFIPYPLQNNIHHLPRDIFWECLNGIIDVHKGNHLATPSHFGEWVEARFGRGLAKWFLWPYNFKTWGYPPDELDWSWVGDRIATVDLRKVLRNYVYKKDDISWGPNSRFRFPLYGGTGAIWRAMAERLPQEKIHLNHEVRNMFVRDREVLFSDGTRETYDLLLTTIPLIRLVKMADLEAPFDTQFPLKYSSTHIVGLGLKGNPPEHLATKCWIYFPEDNCPFYRVTVFSNYSPNNVPDIKNQWSLMCEVSESSVRKIDRQTVVEDVIQGALNSGLLSNRRQIGHTWYHWVAQGYPTPTLGRNRLAFPLLRHLEELGIYSRGRFGAWRYEVGNMDHSFMQGVECINRVLGSGEELTLWYPEIVNNRNFLGGK